MVLQLLAAERDWLSTSEASRELGVHPDTLRRWADAGDVAVFVTPGNHRRFARSEIRRIAGAAAEHASGPTERLVLDYCRAPDHATRSRLLRLAERRGETLGREARASGSSLGQAISVVLGVRSRFIDRLVRGRSGASVADANVVFDRILVGLAASRMPLAPR